MDYLDAPENDTRRHRGDEEGIYNHYRVTNDAGFTVLLILLDVRYNREDDLRTISESQFTWLESVLNEQKDDIVLVGSGIQFLMDNRLFHAEHWVRSDLKRLINMLSTKKYLLISGDVHHA